MNVDENSEAPGARRPPVLKRFWRAFNRWRKRYLAVRLLFLLLFAAYVCQEAFCPLVPRLVRTVVQAIEAISEPSLVNATARFRRVRFAHQLQSSLRRFLDRDGDGSLNPDELNRALDFGLQPEELQKKSIDASLPRLIEACRRAGLLPTSYTARVARREAWFAALGEVEQMKKPVREEIEGMLRAWQMPDYSRLETWKRGAVRFLEWVHIPVFALGRPRTVAAYLASCVFISLMATSFVPRGRLAIALLLACAPWAPFIFGVLEWVVFSLWGPRDYFRSCSGTYTRTYVYYFVGLLCLSMASTAYGARIASGRRSRRFYFFTGALGLGIALLLWNLHCWLFGEAWWPGSELSETFAEARVGGDWLLLPWRYWVRNWVRVAAAAVGGASLITGCVGFARLRRSRRRTKRRIFTKEAGEEEHQE